MRWSRSKEFAHLQPLDPALLWPHRWRVVGGAGWRGAHHAKLTVYPEAWAQTIKDRQTHADLPKYSSWPPMPRPLGIVFCFRLKYCKLRLKLKFNSKSSIKVKTRSKGANQPAQRKV